MEVPAISKHLKNIFDTNELDGKNYQTTNYRLEAILAVGFRVNSTQAIQFFKDEVICKT